ncbi:hypothetical protein [Spiroplasma endosymbiont of Asaphidion curtum]
MRFFAILFTCTYKYNSAIILISNARSLIITCVLIVCFFFFPE